LKATAAKFLGDPRPAGGVAWAITTWGLREDPSQNIARRNRLVSHIGRLPLLLFIPSLLLPASTFAVTKFDSSQYQ
jgi:hypothetical protein